MSKLKLTVTDIRSETQIVRAITLKASDGEPLPAFTPGAHLKVSIPGQKAPRCYSLVCLDDDPAAFEAPACYHLGVRLEDPSTGGSRHMHSLSVGDELEVDGPRNDFELHEAQINEHAVVLVAGGIGITPIASMAASLKRAGRAFVLHYYGRSRAQMAFLDVLAAQHGEAVHMHADDEEATQLPLNDLLDSVDQKQHLYVCGPKGLIDAVVEQSHGRQWPHAHVHFELFSTPAPQEGDAGFEVELRQSGQVFHIPPDKTILEVLEEAGCDPLFDCRRGECGVCQVVVLEGRPDHRDYYLSEAERDANDVMQICVSRSHSDRLVLDL
ncbi:PDR/VanB family oxidoreductase [Allopusillimonas ginsengisoli]|uniref:PDR/VanB family oxidoreductase n=1 Tax=Allopusillimonas ginsengisoli TaxID=453575 RepID=UPI00101F152B|nr:PDR/VanB family oxidoreductase [Allopusillimonas ginsengisoli]TEA76884.1 oxidoreductase [Allopusillimonas ginsengisoli]